eukprot:scaffold91196_cov36-Phaeocystis_antarctica.AAC.2
MPGSRRGWRGAPRRATRCRAPRAVPRGSRRGRQSLGRGRAPPRDASAAPPAGRPCVPPPPRVPRCRAARGGRSPPAAVRGRGRVRGKRRGRSPPAAAASRRLSQQYAGPGGGRRLPRRGSGAAWVRPPRCLARA